MEKTLKFSVALLFVMLSAFATHAQRPHISFIKGKVKYQFNFEQTKIDSMPVHLHQGDTLIANTWTKNMKFSFDSVPAGEYQVWVRVPNRGKYEQDGIIVVLGRDGYALPAYPTLEITEVNMDGLEPEEADRVRIQQVKWEKQQRKLEEKGR